MSSQGSRNGLAAAALGAVLSGCVLVGLLLCGSGADGGAVAADTGGGPVALASVTPISAGTFAASTMAGTNSASPQSERREHVIELPEDGGQWSLTIVYATNDHSSADDRRLRAAFWSSARLRSLVAQTNTTTYHPQDKLWQTKFRPEYGDVLPQIVLQDDKGNLAYKASGANIPSYHPDLMADEIQLGVERLVQSVRVNSGYPQYWHQSGGQSFGHLADPRGQNAIRPQQYPYQAPYVPVPVQPSQPSQNQVAPVSPVSPIVTPARVPAQDCVGPNCPPNRPNTPQGPTVAPWNNGRIPDIRPQLPFMRQGASVLQVVGIAVAAGVFVGLVIVLLVVLLKPAAQPVAQPLAQPVYPGQPLYGPPQGQYGQYGPTR